LVDAFFNDVPRLALSHKLLRIGLAIDGHGGPMNIVSGNELFERQWGMSVDPTAIHQSGVNYNPCEPGRKSRAALEGF
jgi:hypothetical protein